MFTQKSLKGRDQSIDQDKDVWKQVYRDWQLLIGERRSETDQNGGKHYLQQ
jgi:hypothetical protein